MEEAFYYNRRKCFLYGIFLILVTLIFRPFTVLARGGVGGLIGFLLISLPLLLNGFNYIWKGFMSVPALLLKPEHLDIDNFYWGRQQIAWRDIKEIDYHYSPDMPRFAINGHPIQIPFLMDTNYVNLLIYDGRKIKVRLDALQLEERDLEQLLLEYKRLYYFPSAVEDDLLMK